MEPNGSNLSFEYGYSDNSDDFYSGGGTHF